jgi:hypothetical protein
MGESPRIKARLLLSCDPKALFLRRVVKRGGVKKEDGRFKCGHLSRLTKAHLVPGEFFPYGASGAALLYCAICLIKKP